ncbi:MAG: 30S ribosomal protein S6 [Alphaproteobacteria bacterium]|nr:30S ribosomal protein S6 [Alphaproteobacteria bacterium]
MQHYEIMVIFTPVLSEEDYKKSCKFYQDFIKENKGDIIHSNPWGLKSLAYPIKKKTFGIYWVLEYTGDNKINEALKIQIQRDENVMRHLIIKLDKNGVHYNEVIRKGGFPKQVLFDKNQKEEL